LFSELLLEGRKTIHENEPHDVVFIDGIIPDVLAICITLETVTLLLMPFVENIYSKIFILPWEEIYTRRSPL
jgi:hypothetical protein